MEPATAIRISWACAEERQRSKRQGSAAFPTRRTAVIGSSPTNLSKRPKDRAATPFIHTCGRMIGPTNIRGVIDATFKWIRPAPALRAPPRNPPAAWPPRPRASARRLPSGATRRRTGFRRVDRGPDFPRGRRASRTGAASTASSPSGSTPKPPGPGDRAEALEEGNRDAPTRGPRACRTGGMRRSRDRQSRAASSPRSKARARRRRSARTQR
jgi:hypothetical protein